MAQHGLAFSTPLNQRLPQSRISVAPNPFLQPGGGGLAFGGVNPVNSNTLPGEPGFLPPVDLPGEGFDFNNALSNFSLGAQGIAGLAGALNARKQTGLLEDQLGIQRNLLNRNIGNEAITTNLALANQADIGAQLTTGAEFGTPEHLAAKKRLTRTVDGSPVA